MPSITGLITVVSEVQIVRVHKNKVLVKVFTKHDSYELWVKVGDFVDITHTMEVS